MAVKLFKLQKKKNTKNDLCSIFFQQIKSKFSCSILVFVANNVEYSCSKPLIDNKTKMVCVAKRL